MSSERDGAAEFIAEPPLEGVVGLASKQADEPLEASGTSVDQSSSNTLDESSSSLDLDGSTRRLIAENFAASYTAPRPPQPVGDPGLHVDAEGSEARPTAAQLAADRAGREQTRRPPPGAQPSFMSSLVAERQKRFHGNGNRSGAA